MHSPTSYHLAASSAAPVTETKGLVMDWGWRYDAMVWAFDTFVFRGKLRTLRQTAADLADPQPGEAVLDVGCGTGTLALALKERVGSAGRVAGIDPGPRQIARARLKAARRGMALDFEVGVIERLPFPAESFDAVLSTLMMHHLPEDLKRQGFAEILRVLKPGGRIVVVDLKRPEKPRHGSAGFGGGTTGIQDQPALMADAGFSGIETGDIRLPRFPGLSGAGFARGEKQRVECTQKS